MNSDGVALAVAEQLKAIKLIFVTSQRRSDLPRRARFDRCSSPNSAKLVQQDAGGFRPEMLSKAQHAVAACNAGVPRVHVDQRHAGRGPARRGVLQLTASAR